MTPTEAVAQYVAKHLKSPCFCIAYSGGVDSHVLLALMADLARRDRTLQIRAIHVDHSLQPDSARWADHARSICAHLEVPLEVRTCDVQDTDDGPEASARQARYREFADILSPEEHILLAQHAEDQAETFLLQALRGSGPDGLASIPRKRRFANGYLGRPLLFCSKESLLELAEKRKLEWIEDPSNRDLQFDRNFLRHEVMPQLRSRWPAVSRTLARSAMLCAASTQSLNSFAHQDLQSVTQPGQPELRISALASLPRERAFAAIRLWVRQRELRMPRLQDLRQVHANLINARADSHGVVNVRDYEFRRYRDNLYLLLPQKSITPYRHLWTAPFKDFFIPETGLTLTRDLCASQGLCLPETGTVSIKSRAGGELIRVGKPEFHKSVKQILQESAIPPWKREAIPLLYIQGRLAAVWNLAIATEFHQAPQPEKDSIGSKRGVKQALEPAQSPAATSNPASVTETA